MQLNKFVDFLIYQTGLNMTALAKELNVSRQTLSNWKNERIDNIDTETINKIEGAMRRNKWGITISSHNNGKVEIITTTDQANAAVNSHSQIQSDKAMADDMVKNQINYIKMLEGEIVLLKEQLAKCKSKK